MNRSHHIVLGLALAIGLGSPALAAPKTAAERQAAAKEAKAKREQAAKDAAARRQAERDAAIKAKAEQEAAAAREKAEKEAAAKAAAEKEAAEKEAAAKKAAEEKDKAEREAVKAALKGVGTDGVVLINKLHFAVKDITHEQMLKAVPIARVYDAEISALQSKHRDAHQEMLSESLRTRTKIDLDADRVVRGSRTRTEHRVEAKYFDQVGNEVLTPAQRDAWDAYRLHFVSAFQLAFTGATEEEAKKLAPLCLEVVKDMPRTAGTDGYSLFQKRLLEVKDRAAKQVLNDEQRKKYATIRASNVEFERKIDEFERQQPPAAAVATPPSPAPGAAGGDGLD
jgi:hypothetical protein